MKDVDFGEPTSFLDHVYVGCTQRECQISQDIVDSYRNMIESKISAGTKEKRPCSGKLGADIPSWSYDMEGHAKKFMEQYCEVAKRTIQQMGSVGEFSMVCSPIGIKCLCLARIGRPDILWSVNKLARAITKWTRACDKRLARLISCRRS